MTLPTWLRKGAAEAERILRVQPGLAAAYLYGSALRSPRHRDVDIALLYRFSAPRPSDRQLAQTALALDKAFGSETDLQILSELPDPVCFRVIGEGARFLTLDPLTAVRFQSETLIRFLDFKPAYDFHTEKILARTSLG